MSRTRRTVSAPDRPDRLRLEFWPVERLIPSARNARTHSDAQVAEIAGSIRAFGFTNPVLVGEEGDIIAGHGRLAAARQLGLGEVPVIPLQGLTELQRRQLVLADNRIALNAGWDVDMLHLELKDLSALGADLSVLGFSAAELAAALNPVSAGLTDENEVPALADKAVTTIGIFGAWDLTGWPAATAPMRNSFSAAGQRVAPADGDRPALRGRIRPRCAIAGA